MESSEQSIFSLSKKTLLNYLLIAILLILILFYLDRRNIINLKSEASKSTQESREENNNFISNKKLITVNIEGAIQNPGVFELEEGKRISDLIIIAGGFSKDVDILKVSKDLNKAEKLTDGMKIWIPFFIENNKSTDSSIASLQDVDVSSSQKNTQSESSSAKNSGNENLSVININNSSKEDLDKLPRIGPVSADKIIENRPYASIEELISKDVVNQSTFDQIKDLISI